MKTLSLHLLRQVIATLLMTLLVFTFVLVLGNVFKEVLGMLVNRQASLGIVVYATGLLMPFAIAYAMPMAVLTAVLLVFGRFSADLELTAARASGISLLSLAAPILAFSLGLCALSAWVNLELAPRARAAYRQLIYKFTSELSIAQLPEGRHIKDIPGYIVFIGKNRNGKLEDVLVYNFGQGTNPPASLFAPTADVQIDTSGTNRVALLNLHNVQGVTLQEDQASPFSAELIQISYDLSRFGRTSGRTAVGNMSFAQLRAEMQAIRERVLEQSNTVGNSEREKFVATQLAKLSSPVKVEMSQQLAFSFAPFAFTLIGIPLGIRVQRRETNIGFAMSLILVAVYYSLIMLGLALERHPEYSPHLLLWLPNLLFQIVGAALLWRANRGL